MAKVATAIKAALTLVPLLSEPRSCFVVAPSLVRTIKMPSNERKIPTAAISMGAMTALNCMSLCMEKATAPRAAVERILPQ